MWGRKSRCAGDASEMLRRRGARATDPFEMNRTRRDRLERVRGTVEGWVPSENVSPFEGRAFQVLKRRPGYPFARYRVGARAEG